MTTVNISLDTARHAVACIQARASEGVKLALVADADSDPDARVSLAWLLPMLEDLKTAQKELLTAIDQAKGAQE